MPDYSQGKIYRLVCDDPDLVYIGSTTWDLPHRLNQHKTQLNCSSKSLFDIGGVKIELIEQYPCESKEELLCREKYYFETMNCINKNKPIQTKDELKEYDAKWHREWRKANPELSSQKKKKEWFRHHEENKAKLRERGAKRREALGKEEYNRRQREYYRLRQLAKKGC